MYIIFFNKKSGGSFEPPEIHPAHEPPKKHLAQPMIWSMKDGLKTIDTENKTNPTNVAKQQKLTSCIFLLKVDRLRRKCYLITLEIQGTRWWQDCLHNEINIVAHLWYHGHLGIWSGKKGVFVSKKLLDTFRIWINGAPSSHI